jgi:two-component system, LytTR family, sensor kinase
VIETLRRPFAAVRARIAARPFPPALPGMRPADWVIIGAGWLALAVASAGPLVQIAARQRGVVVTPHDMLIGQLLDALVWLALLWPLFAALDSTPFRRGVWVRNVLLRGLAIAAAAVAQGTINWAVIHTLGPFVVEDPSVLRADALVGFRATVTDAFDALPLPLLVYVGVRLVVRRRERDRAAAEATVAAREARLHALATEMRPHFLFNALNDIALLVRTDPRRAEEMIVQLADLLRLTLDVGARREQPLADELHHLEQYLALQQMRFGDRLTIHRCVEPEVLDALVPPMLLQPLAENALAHGIEPKPGPGTLEITARRDGPDLVLTVRDDGAGLPALATRRERTGLANTRTRLALLYTGAHALSLEPAPDGGTIVTVRLPFRRAVAPAARLIANGGEP